MSHLVICLRISVDGLVLPHPESTLVISITTERVGEPILLVLGLKRRRPDPGVKLRNEVFHPLTSADNDL